METLRGLSGKVAIVTGGGRGIGRAITLRLAEEGCKVAIFDIKPDAGQETAKLAPQSSITTYAVDVGDRASVDSAVAKVEAEIGPIWALVNNAGWDKPMPFLKTDRELWDKIIRINLYGPLNTHHAIAPLMADRGGGRIVNIASDAARVGTSGEGEQAVKWKDAMLRGIPLKRMGEPEDYGGIVALLASDDGKFITGQTIS